MIEQLRQEEIAAGLHDKMNIALRVRWVNKLRQLVGATLPKNAGGVPLVSDIDLILAGPEFRQQALEFILKS